MKSSTKMEVIKKISQCRVCKSEQLDFVGSLGELAISVFTDKPTEGKKCPLTLLHCNNCSLVQLEHTAPQEFLYTKHYWYKSATNPVIANDLKDIAEKAIRFSGIKDTEIFLDIGANDGTLLKNIPSNFIRVAVEPAINFDNNLRMALNHKDLIYNDFWENLNLPFKAKVITAIGMFYDSDNPNVFISNVKKHLTDNGTFVAQLMTLKPMIEMNDVGNICHEHLEYYSYQSLVKLFEQNGLEIYSVEKNDINGGSYRIYARHFKHGSIPYLGEMPYTLTALKAFFRRIEENKQKTIKFIENANNQHKTVFAYGASTKGNTVLQYYGLNATLISGVADKDESKHGKFMVGTGIPITGEEFARVASDYFFILPWGFTDQFIIREKGWRDKGGKFIVSIPKFKVI